MNLLGTRELIDGEEEANEDKMVADGAVWIGVVVVVVADVEAGVTDEDECWCWDSNSRRSLKQDGHP